MATPADPKIDIKKLEWAISFSQRDLETLKEGDWLNLKEELWEFFTEEIEWSFGPKTQTFKNEDIIALGRLIIRSTPSDPVDFEVDVEIDKDGEFMGGSKPKEKVQLELESALYRKDKKSWYQKLGIEYTRNIQEALRAMLQDVQRDHNAPNLLHFDWSSSGSDLCRFATYRLHLYLVATGIEKSQICTCPDDCNRTFLIKRKPRVDVTFHCSLRCSRRAANRAYRERLMKGKAGEVKVKEREKSRRRYVEKQRRKLGPNVKVGRRPR